MLNVSVPLIAVVIGDAAVLAFACARVMQGQWGVQSAAKALPVILVALSMALYWGWSRIPQNHKETGRRLMMTSSAFFIGSGILVESWLISRERLWMSLGITWAVLGIWTALVAQKQSTKAQQTNRL